MSPQESIAHYRITAKLGAGGMGEVYRAMDTKLGREVAVKVLPHAFADDPDRMARFQREAKVLASLNHPNIAAIYGVEDRAIIMELVEGPTLAERLEAGALTVEDALKIAAQIADALEAAHEQGIVHRDLKPANIKAPQDGRPKVLDLGLAMMSGGGAAAVADAANPADSPTLSMGATKVGLILGTAAYMSPEQASGKRVDKRADIWAFGVVLWEMLTGQKLFGGGETVSHTLADVLRGEIDFAKLPAATPPAIRELLMRCLDRDVQTRLRDIGEARVVIHRWLANPASVVEAAPSRVRSSMVNWAVAVLAVCAGGLAFVHFRESPAEDPVIRSTILPPDNTEWDFTSGQGLSAALSPDGRRIVFGVRSGDGKNLLWIRSLDGLAAQPLPGTDHGSFPFWSPDSRFIAFFADSKLKKIAASGGPALTLADAPLGRGGSWNQDGVILFANSNQGPLLRVSSAGGGAAIPLPVEGRFPWFLPDGVHFLYQIPTGLGDRSGKIPVGSLSGGAAKVVAEQASTNAVYAQGHLLFLREGTLMAQPFDPKRLVTAGEAVPLAEQVQTVLNSRTVGAFSVSGSGLLVYGASAAVGGAVLTWFDLNGKPDSTIGDPAPLATFSFSPNGKSIAATVIDRAGLDIWTYDMDRGRRTRLTFGGGTDPVWSPDGHTITFRSNRKGHWDLYRKSSDGAGSEELLYTDDLDKNPTSWSRDGILLYHTNTSTPKTGADLWALPLTPERPGAPLKPVPVLQTPFLEGYGQFSPDGRWIAYVSNESQRAELYVAAFSASPTGPGTRRQISTAGVITTPPRWRPDGREIFFEGADGHLMAAEVTTRANTIEVGAVRPLFRFDRTLGVARYDVSADGQRLLVAVAPQQKSSPPLTLIANWPAALKKQ